MNSTRYNTFFVHFFHPKGPIQATFGLTWEIFPHRLGGVSNTGNPREVMTIKQLEIVFTVRIFTL